MIISHKYKFIFIKTRKTAGTSIEIYLSQYCDTNDILTPIIPYVEPHIARNNEGYRNHISALDVKNKVGNKIWSEYFVFCVERNPWDKTISYYNMQNIVQKTKLSLDEYLSTKDLCSDYDLYTDDDGNVIVDRIIKYENLNNELSKVFKELKIPFDGVLDIYAKSEYRKNKKKYQTYFTNNQINIIRQSHHKEIKLLGYSFNEKNPKSPIYIHSLFRSGSTYIFNKFRNFDENFYCYQEPFNEHLLITKRNPDEILEMHSDVNISLRHPSLDKPYFFEFHPIAKQVSKYLDDSLCYKNFFDSKDGEGKLNSYINCLITHTDKVPVLQMCRSFGRTDAFNNGRNIFLWRNPWDQWWSYKVDDYFNVRNLLILNADNLPPFLDDIREKVGIDKFESDNLDVEILHFGGFYLNSNDNYLIFYALWCYSLIENYLKMDLLLSIDGLSTSTEYRRHVTNELESMNVFNMDLSDCRSPVGFYTREDKRFFAHIETQVHKLLLKTYPEKQVDAILSLKHEFSPNRVKNEKKTEISNLRKIVIRQDNKFHEDVNSIFSRSKEKIDSIQLNFHKELEGLNKELQKTHEDNHRINELYLSIVRSNSWKILKRLHPIIDFFKSTMLKNESDYLTLKPSNPKNKELIVDITHIHKKDLKTGIQRVVRSILKEFKGKDFNEKYVVKTVFLDSKMIYKYCDDKRVVVPKNGDIYLGLDLNAKVVGLGSMFSLWESRGVNINFVVFDIIPILHPYWWDANVSVVHEQWLKTVLRYSNNVACISESVANDVRNYHSSSKLFQSNTVKVKSFHLGADIENSHPSSGMPKNAAICQKKMSEQSTFLMVGTIEPRKGYQEALDAFNLLWSQGKELNLVVVGKKGWMMDNFLIQVEGHKKLNKSLFYFDNASDEFLEELYKKSTCLIAASEAEGFGLPLIEAAKYHLPVIARDIPVFKEVASDYASFFTANSLAETISHWLRHDKADKHPKYENIKIWTWRQSARELATIINL